MIVWHWERFLQALGYRKFHYFPSRRSLPICDFHSWEYRPDLERGSYDAEHNPPRQIA